MKHSRLLCKGHTCLFSKIQFTDSWRHQAMHGCFQWTSVNASVTPGLWLATINISSSFCSRKRKRHHCLCSPLVKSIDGVGETSSWKKALKNNVSSDSLLAYKHLTDLSSSDWWEKLEMLFIWMKELPLLIPKHTSQALWISNRS